MKKLFPTLAVLMVMLLAIWMISCGEDEEEVGPDAHVASTDPAAGSTTASNGKLTIKFDSPPEKGTVKVNGISAVGSGTTYTWSATGLTQDKATLNIKWINPSGALGSHSIILTVKPVTDKQDEGEVPGDAWQIAWVRVDKATFQEVLSTEHIYDYDILEKQDILAVKVLDQKGLAVPNARVEWTLLGSNNAVGDIIETDDPGFAAPQINAAPQIKVDNKFAITFTNKEGERTREMAFKCPSTVSPNGTPVPTVINVGKEGETWIVITAARIGATDIAAYCPDIVAKSPNPHKIFATNIWNRYDWKFPSHGVNDCETLEHRFTTKIFNYPDENDPWEDGVDVRYTILNPQGSTFVGDGIKTVVPSDSNGEASATLQVQKPPANPIKVLVEILLKEGDKELGTAGCAIVTKEWQVEELDVTTPPSDPLCLTDISGNFFQVTNQGPPPAGNVTLTVDYPAGITVVNTDGGTDDGDKITWGIGTLPPGATSRQFTPDFTASGGGVYSFRAEAESRCAAKTVEWPVNVEDFDVETPSNDLFFCLTDTSVDIPGTFSVTNQGAPSKITLTIDYPEGITVVDSDGGTDDGDKIVWDIGNLPQGDSRQFKPTFNASSGGEYRFRATAKSEYCETTENWTINVEHFELTTPERLVRCLEDANAISGTFSVKNHGVPLADDAKFTVDYPNEIKKVVDSDGGTDDGDKIVWDIGNLPQGASRQFTPTFDASSGGEYRFTATVKSKCPPKSKTWTVKVIEIGVNCEFDKSIVELDPGEFFGGPISSDPRFIATYIVTVENRGGDTVNATLTVTIPDGLRIVDGVPEQPITINPDKTITRRLKLKGTREGVFAVPATVENISSVTDPTVSCPSQSTIPPCYIEVKPNPAMLVTKVDTIDPIIVGGQTTYRITIVNQGAADAENVKLRDILPTPPETGEQMMEVVGDEFDLEFGHVDSDGKWCKIRTDEIAFDTIATISFPAKEPGQVPGCPDAKKLPGETLLTNTFDDAVGILTFTFDKIMPTWAFRIVYEVKALKAGDALNETQLTYNKWKGDPIKSDEGTHINPKPEQ